VGKNNTPLHALVYVNSNTVKGPDADHSYIGETTDPAIDATNPTNGKVTLSVDDTIWGYDLMAVAPAKVPQYRGFIHKNTTGPDFSCRLGLGPGFYGPRTDQRLGKKCHP